MPNIFEARVEELIYLGDNMRIRVNLSGHDDFVVKVPNPTGQVQPTPGETVRVGWNAEDCRAIDA